MSTEESERVHVYNFDHPGNGLISVGTSLSFATECLLIQWFLLPQRTTGNHKCCKRFYATITCSLLLITDGYRSNVLDIDKHCEGWHTSNLKRSKLWKASSFDWVESTERMISPTTCVEIDGRGYFVRRLVWGARGRRYYSIHGKRKPGVACQSCCVSWTVKSKGSSFFISNTSRV